MGIAIPSNFESDIKDLGPICYICIAEKTEPELQGKELRINCSRCDRPYCNKHCSAVDSQFCKECVKDFQVIEKHDTRNGVQEFVVIDPTGKKDDSVVRIPYKTKFKQITLLGTDWLFYETAISAMSDTQLEAALQWHKAAVTEIEIEITEHKVRKAHNLAKLPLPKVTPIKKPFDQQKAMAKASNLMEVFAKIHGADALQQALNLLKQKGVK